MASSSRAASSGEPVARRRRVPWTDVVALALVAAVVLPRLVPGVEGDRGIFVSTAERMRAGDRLYRDVWDNKDPLFYYLLALGRSVAAGIDVLLELGWMAGAVLAVAVLARWSGQDRRSVRMLALGATPVVLAASTYVAGGTHLPGIALCLLAAASVVSGRFVLAGALVGALLVTKLVMAPVAVAVLAPILWPDRRPRHVARLAVGGALVVAAMGAVLAVRGELGPYLDALARNASYSGGPFLVGSEYGPVVGHLGRVATAPVLWLTAATALIVVATRPRRRGEGSLADGDPRASLWVAVVASAAAGWIVLAVTGLWEHHAQILHVSAVLAVLVAVAAAGPLAAPSGRRIVVLPLLVALGVVGPWSWVQPSSVARAADAVASYDEVAPETRALRASGPPTSYARVGSNDDLGHAAGLAEWDLACPRFHQYFFEPVAVLDEVVDCLPRADAIVVSPGFRPIAGNEGWNDFVERVEALLEVDRTCREHDGVRVCRRDGG